MSPLPPISQDSIMMAARNKLEKLFTSVGMPESHGMSHCLVVLGHMEKAISGADPSMTKLLTPDMVLSLKLASLLHEADDHKYFKNSTNARDILKEVIPADDSKDKIISDVEEMISYVSASSNGNTVPTIALSNPTFLWPRFCDRLEAIGVVGAVRCYQYNRETTAPLMIATTPRPTTEQEMWMEVTEARWRKYQQGGNSISMMDHYYDKLLQIAHFDPAVVANSYLQGEAAKRVQPLMEICLEAGRTGKVPVEMLERYERELAV